jgi:hypothetical protein
MRKIEKQSANKTKMQVIFSPIDVVIAANMVDCRKKIVAVRRTTIPDGQTSRGESTSDATDHGAEIEARKEKDTVVTVTSGETGLERQHAGDGLDHPENLKVGIGIDHL